MVTVNVSNNTRAFYLPLRRKATWNVNGKHASAGLIEALNPNIKRSTNLAVEAGTQHAIKHHVSRCQQVNQLLARRTNKHGNSRANGDAATI